ncbi:MAG TPA: hypothetical protein VHO50_00445 [Bacteroidales bacterium]|nr:hypothetical protein [Bacteroidales bacterium]
MKKICLITALFVMPFVSFMAQEKIIVSDDSLSFANSKMPGFTIFIPEADYEKTVKNWTKLLESGTRSKVIDKNNEMTIFGARIKEISDNPVNIYSIINDNDESVELQAAIELERDQFIGVTEAGKAKEYLFDFAREQYLDVANEQLDDEKSKLRSLENELSTLQREQERIERSSRENAKVIAEEQERIKSLNQELDYLTSETTVSDTSVIGMGGRNTNVNKDREKEIKKTEREIRTAEKKISRSESEIDANSHEIPRNAEAREELRNRITEQQVIVSSYENKVDVIKKSEL